MGELARSVHDHGGTVVGVIPQGLVDRELAYDPADELLVTGIKKKKINYKEEVSLTYQTQQNNYKKFKL